jgi:hypothetical protein
MNLPRITDGTYGRHGPSYCGIISPVDNRVWWLLDLGMVYYVAEVFIVARKDCCQDQMHNLQVRIGNSSLNGGNLNPSCGDMFSMTSLASLSVFCEPYGYGRYLSIAKYDVQGMTLCEVAVFQIENGKFYLKHK